MKKEKISALANLDVLLKVYSVEVQFRGQILIYICQLVLQSVELCLKVLCDVHCISDSIQKISHSAIEMNDSDQGRKRQWPFGAWINFIK